MGAFQLLPLAHGPPHGHGDSPPRQPPPRRLCQRHPLPARQSRSAQGRLRPRPAHRHALWRDRRHPDGHQHDPAAGRFREVSSASRPAPPPAWPTSPAKPAQPCCRASCCGNRPSGATSSTSAPKSRFRTPATLRPTSSPAPSNAPRPSNPGFGAILTSGCGFTAAGRRGLPGNQLCTVKPRQH